MPTGIPSQRPLEPGMPRQKTAWEPIENPIQSEKAPRGLQPDPE